LLYNLYKLI